MFKDVFVLKKTSWHVKMMKYIWGIDHKYFSHMCPYWWLSVFNVLFAFLPVALCKEGWKPFWFIFKIVGKILAVPMNWIADKCSKLYDIYKAGAEIRAEKRRIRDRQLMIDRQQAKDEEEKAIVADLKSKPIEEVIAKYKGKINDAIMKAVMNQDWNFYKEIEGKVYNYEWAQKREKERAERLAAQKTSEWGQTTEEPMNKVKEKARDWEAERKEKERQRMLAAKAYINKLNNLIKPFMKVVVWVIGSFACAAALYGLFLSLPYIWKAIKATGYAIWWFIRLIGHAISSGYHGVANTKHETWSFLGTCASVVFCAVILFVIIFAGARWLNKYYKAKGRYRHYYSKPKGSDKFEAFGKSVKKNVFSPIGRAIVWFFTIVIIPFVFIGKVLGKMGILFGKYFMDFLKFLKNCITFFIQMLKNNCPAIKWED